MALFKRAFSYAARRARAYGPGALKYVGSRVASAAIPYLTRKALGSMSRPAARGRGRATITTQRDAVTRVTRRGRRGRVDPFTRKFRNALLREQPTLMYQSVRKARITVAAGSAAYTALALLDTNTNADGDILNVFKDTYSTAVLADLEDNALYLRSAGMTLQMKNSGADEAFVDVYEIIAKRDINLATAASGNIADIYGDAFSDMIDVGSTADNWIGMTLYDVPEFTRQFKILKKTTLKLEVGKSASVSMGAKMNYRVVGKRLVTANACLKGVTRAFFVMARGPANNDISASGTAAAQVDCSVFKTIRYATPPTSVLSETIGQTK